MAGARPPKPTAKLIKFIESHNLTNPYLPTFSPSLSRNRMLIGHVPHIPWPETPFPRQPYPLVTARSSAIGSLACAIRSSNSAFAAARLLVTQNVNELVFVCKITAF